MRMNDDELNAFMDRIFEDEGIFAQSFYHTADGMPGCSAGVQATLITFGFDKDWVRTTVKECFDRKLRT